jgi:hypothetical protein
MYIDNSKHKDVEITAIAIVEVHIVNKLHPFCVIARNLAAISKKALPTVFLLVIHRRQGIVIPARYHRQVV